jgi:polyketide synthase PksM
VFDVAIIGLSGRYPGADNLAQFWENLKAGRHGMTEIPTDRWDWRAYFYAEKGKLGSIYTKWGGFLSEIDTFDPLFFRILPAEAQNMDPQERLFIEEAYAAIEDAGYTPATWRAQPSGQALRREHRRLCGPHEQHLWG